MIWGVILFLPFLGHSLEVTLVVGLSGDVVVIFIVGPVVVVLGGLDSLTVVVTGVGIV